MDKRRLMYRILSAIAFSVLLLASLGVAQPRTTPAPSRSGDHRTCSQ